MPTRNATATWEGGIKDGKGTFKGESGQINASYSFGSRFENAPASNPEELLAAAEAACFSMALSGNLERKGAQPKRLETRAACTVEKQGDGFRITTMKLTVRGEVASIDEATFKSVVEQTKETCPVSVALKGVKIDVEAQLTQAGAPRDKRAGEEARM